MLFIYILFLSTSSVSLSFPVWFLLLEYTLYSNLLVAIYQSVVYSLTASCCLLISSAFYTSACTLGYFLLLICSYPLYAISCNWSLFIPPENRSQAWNGIWSSFCNLLSYWFLLSFWFLQSASTFFWFHSFFTR